jgi:hypothetical protein
MQEWSAVHTQLRWQLMCYSVHPCTPDKPQPLDYVCLCSSDVADMFVLSLDSCRRYAVGATLWWCLCYDGSLPYMTPAEVQYWQSCSVADWPQLGQLIRNRSLQWPEGVRRSLDAQCPGLRLLVEALLHHDVDQRAGHSQVSQEVKGSKRVAANWEALACRSTCCVRSWLCEKLVMRLACPAHQPVLHSVLSF